MDYRPLKIKNLARALRLPFLTASVLPYFYGSFIFKNRFSFLPFLLGLISVVFTHLGANLINDYSDSKSGADWQDKTFYGFFGGSKLIQEGLLKESWYFKMSLLFFALAFFSVLGLSFVLEDFTGLFSYFVILFLGLAYSYKPFQFSYHYFGELIIFFLFGPAIVIGAYFIQSGIFLEKGSFILSLPFGFFTALILYSNQIPDYDTDKCSGKLNLVNLFPINKAFIGYYLIASLGFLSILFSFFAGYSSKISLVSLLTVVIIIKAAKILKNDYNLKAKLVVSSRLTILTQNIVGVVLLLDILV
ncbi:MAG: prenyltransferase [Candidatus Omnitrophica bacterium]|nr:prenyltransferase [Candidatus Omnitrophota bacterium]